MTTISFFNCSPQVIRDTPGLATRLRYMGINTLELQVWRAPFRDQTYAGWEREWEKWHGSQIDWCVKNNWDFVARMDDGFRTIAEHAALLRWPEAIRHVAGRTWDSGRCVGVELCDEMNPDPRLYPNLDEFGKHWHTVSGPFFACPSYSQGKYAVSVTANYHSCQWLWETCKTYKDHEERMLASLSSFRHDERRICVTLPFVKMYRKRVEGSRFRQGKDRWTYKGLSVPQFERLMRRAMQEGATQFRIYMIETKEQERARANAAIGEPRCQIGTGLADPRWPDLEMVVRRLAIS